MSNGINRPYVEWLHEVDTLLKELGPQVSHHTFWQYPWRAAFDGDRTPVGAIYEAVANDETYGWNR